MGVPQFIEDEDSYFGPSYHVIERPGKRKAGTPDSRRGILVCRGRRSRATRG